MNDIVLVEVSPPISNSLTKRVGQIDEKNPLLYGKLPEGLLLY